MFLGVSLENTTSNEFRFGLGGRYLAFDVLGSGTELRIDADVGSDPSLGIAWYRPLWTRSFFVEPLAGVGAQSFYVIEEGRTIGAPIAARASASALDIGLNIGRFDEVRSGVRYGWTAASVPVGDPGLPGGRRRRHHRAHHLDPRRARMIRSCRRAACGWNTPCAITSARRSCASADAPRTSEGVTQAEGAVSWAKSFDRNLHKRLFLGASAGTSFDTEPLPTEQFALGGPLRMSAYSVGQKRGDHFGMALIGYLHQVMRLPDFLGGPVFIGGWTETGAAFDDFDEIDMDIHFSAGIIADTLIGPVFAGISAGIEGDSRFYIGIGRIFR